MISVDVIYIYVYLYTRISNIWGFPKMVVPNNHGYSYTKMIILGCFGGTTI